jgi:hypothetical protein
MIFKRSNWGEKSMTIYKKQILNLTDYNDAALDSLITKVRASWEQFIANDLPKIRGITANISAVKLEASATPLDSEL